jgi:hypothetical protein
LKLVYLSNRHLQHEVYWRNMTPPLERALSGISGVTVVAPPPLRRPTFRADRPAWLASIRVVRQADAVLWMQMHLRPPLPIWALAYARPLTMRTMIVLDAWRQHLDNLALVVKRQHIRRCFVFYRQAADILAERYPQLGFSWLPVCVDTGVFRDLGRTRDIDFFWIGRRDEALHEALIAYCAERGLTYRYSMHEHDPPTREELGELVARTRYFIATPPNLTNAARTGGFAPLVPRYLEGPAGGARVMGVPCLESDLEYYLPAGGFIRCAPDGSDLADVLDAAESDPDWEAHRIATRDRVVHEHSWERRGREIYDDLASLA